MNLALGISHFNVLFGQKLAAADGFLLRHINDTTKADWSGVSFVGRKERE